MRLTTQLLCTFTKYNKLQQTISDIKSCYTLVFGKIYILENVNNSRELICSYNIDSTKELNADIPFNTISVHRKKEFNTLYTINALNYIVALLNDGKIDSSFLVPWEKYSNCILVTNVDGLKKIDTNIYSVEKFKQ